MTDRPILMSAPMVRAILDGSKSQTRRVVKVPHENPLGSWEVLPWGGPNGGRTRDGQTIPFQNVIGHTRTGEIIGCPYGQPGDRLWVREAWSPTNPISHGVMYRADYESPEVGRWKPSIHMPRWASRITLEVTGVRVERLMDISSDDAAAEGWPGPDAENSIQSAYPIAWYSKLWDQINGPGSWDLNPWVWVVEFKRVPPLAQGPEGKTK